MPGASIAAVGTRTGGEAAPVRARDASLAERLARGCLVLDGGLGTELIARAPELREHLAAGGGLEELCLAAPELVRAVHADFFAAGAEVAITCSFQGHGAALAARGLGSLTRLFARAGARVALEAARGAEAEDGRPRYVLGGLGPPPKHWSPGADANCLTDGYSEQARAFVDAGVDGLLVETVRALEPARVALAAARAAAEAVSRPVALLVSLSPDASGRLGDGTSIEEAAGTLGSGALDLLAVGCGEGPEALTEPLARLARASDRRLGAWPNAGLPIEAGGTRRHPVGPAEFAAWCAARAREHELALVGGCCGASPAHIAAIVQALAAG